jgi:hypothetical protein
MVVLALLLSLTPDRVRIFLDFTGRPVITSGKAQLHIGAPPEARHFKLSDGNILTIDAPDKGSFDIPGDHVVRFGTQAAGSN